MTEKPMNGAESLVRALHGAGVDLCLANPGTSEMQFVDALDRTGVEWVFPFQKARETARERKRLLAVKPVAFGTTPDGGW